MLSPSVIHLYEEISLVHSAHTIASPAHLLRTSLFRASCIALFGGPRHVTPGPTNTSSPVPLDQQPKIPYHPPINFSPVISPKITF